MDFNTWCTNGKRNKLFYTINLFSGSSSVMTS